MHPELHRSALLATITVFVANSFGALLNQASYGFGPLALISAGHALLALVLGALVLRARGRWPVYAYELVYTALVIPFLVDVWLPPFYDVRAGAVREPMLLDHLTLIGIALLAPTLRSGLLGLAAFLIHSLALWMMLEQYDGAFDALRREPWFSLLTAAVAATFLWSRVTRRELSVRVARAEARAEAMAGFGRVVLGLRDRANTPLQTLVVAVELLESDPSTSQEILRVLRASIAKLVAAERTIGRLATRVPLTADVDLERAVDELLDSKADAAEARLLLSPR